MFLSADSEIIAYTTTSHQGAIETLPHGKGWI